MKGTTLLILIFAVVAITLITGCITSNQNNITVVTTPSIQPTTNETTTTTTTETPTAALTLPKMKTIKDSNMLYAVDIPQNWEASDKIGGAEYGWFGLSAKTNFALADGTPPLKAGEFFWIFSYAVQRQGQQQNFRNALKTINVSVVTSDNVLNTHPANNSIDINVLNSAQAEGADVSGYNMTTGMAIQNTASYPTTETYVSINRLNFDRFEVTIGDNTTVVYVGHEGSENAKGYSSIIAFTVNNANDMNLCESIAHSFRYYTEEEISKLQAEEIDNQTITGS